MLLQPGFKQPPQLQIALRQLPTLQWRGLIEGACLLFEQRQIVQRIEDHGFAFIAARVPGDDLARAGDRHFMDVAPHQH